MELFLIQLAWLARMRELGKVCVPDPRWSDVWAIHVMLGSPPLPMGRGKAWGWKHKPKTSP